MDKRFLGILAAIIIIFVGIFVFSKHTDNSGSGSGGAQPSSHIEGKGAKGITLVEYGDFQCPVCEGYHTVVDQVQAKYANDIYFQFRNLPLASVHPNAYVAARAAEAAALQGKFFEMHRLLYDPNDWQVWTASKDPVTYFRSYATQLNLDMNKFNADINSSKVNDTINADLAEFKKTGQAMATPTFFLDGKYVPYDQLTEASRQPSVDKFSAVIDAAIAAKH